MKWLLTPLRGLFMVAAMFVWAAPAVAADTPEFPNFTFYALDGGQSVTVEGLKGQPALLTFWASWCGPCRVELPELQKLNDEFGSKGFQLITVNVDNTEMAARRFLEVTKLDIPVYRMEPRELATLGLESIPTNILLNRQGQPAKLFEGYFEAMPEVLRDLIQPMLEPSGSSDESGE